MPGGRCSIQVRRALTSHLNIIFMSHALHSRVNHDMVRTRDGTSSLPFPPFRATLKSLRSFPSSSVLPGRATLDSVGSAGALGVGMLMRLISG